MSSGDPSPPAASNPCLQGAARFPHYYLSHYALRDIALNDPVGFLTKLASPNAREFVRTVFAFVTEFCKRSGQMPDFSPDEIEITPTSIGAYPVAVLQMPEPGSATEAYLVALVGLYDVATLDTSRDKPKGRYFTLEKSIDSAGKFGTAFGEWRGEYHLNLGEGPIPSVPAFLKRIEEHLEI